MKRALVILLGALLLAVAATASTIAFLAATEGGTRFLAGQAERFLPIRLSGVSGALLREVRVDSLAYDLDDQHLEIEGLTASVEMVPLLFENHLIVHAVRAGSVTLTGGASGPGPPPALRLPFMPLTIDVAEVEVHRLELPGLFPMHVAGSFSWLRGGLVVRSLKVVSDVIVGNLQGRLGHGANPTIALRVNWSLPDRAWGGEGRAEGRVNSFELHHVLRGYVSVDADGRGDLSTLTDPSVDARVKVQDLVFGDTTVSGIAGRVRGTLAEASADLDSRVAAPRVAPFDLKVSAHGPVTGPLELSDVTARALGGTEQAQGTIAWQDDVRLLLHGSAVGVSVAALRADLDGLVNASFELHYQDELLGLALHDLSGTLNQRPIAGTVEVAQLADGWLFAPVRLNLGDNRLSGSARLIGSTVDVQADVDAPALQALALGIGGDLAGSVNLAGDWQNLSGSVALRASRLQGFDTDLTNAELRARLSEGTLHGTLAAARVSRQQLDLDDVRLGADGPLANLAWRLAWTGGEGSGTLHTRDDGYELRLADAQLDLIDERWSLRDPTRLVMLPGKRLEAEPVCISGGGASACVQTFTYENGRIETRGELERAPVALLRPWLPVRLADDGYLQGHWFLAGEMDDLSGEIGVAARSLSYLAADEQEPIALPDLVADATAADGALQVRLTAADSHVSVRGDARLEPLRPDGVLSGSIHVAAADLSPLAAFDQRIETVAGGLQGELALSGSPRQPRLDGQLALSDGRLDLNDPDVALTAIAARMRVDDSGAFDLDGTASQGEQQVRLSARGSGLFDQALQFDAALQGDLSARHPDWEVTLRPDLNLAYAHGRGRVRGRVVVPKAEVRLSTLPASVPSPSEDVIVVGRETPGDGERDTNRFRADVEVVLGDDVTLKALGLTADLEGALRARLDAQGRTTLRGTLNVTDGVLTTQGQTLTIESGTVVYNGPVDRPYIDVKAVRTIDTVTPTVKVGLHITGDADNLSSSVYSDPAMSETRALSFLVLGRDIEQQTADSDSNRLVAAAINLGLSRSKGIASELMRMTGLDELSASAETQNSFAIIAGKRINDKIYVRYTYNTLSALGAFLVRYDLTRKWQLEARSGQQSAMDLLYSFEK